MQIVIQEASGKIKEVLNESFPDASSEKQLGKVGRYNAPMILK